MMQAFIILVVCGLLLIGAEIFIPGGVLGLIGGLALLAAVFVSFTFGAQFGVLATLMIIILLGVCIIIWIKFFPNTPVGRALTLSGSTRAYKATSEEMPSLLGKEGVATTTLRPAGIAEIEQRRIDVVADGGWIEQNRPVRVIEVSGNRVVVEEIEEPAGDDSNEDKA
jgi:membrane-bound serine protease (ClpP class)